MDVEGHSIGISSLYNQLYSILISLVQCSVFNIRAVFYNNVQLYYVIL